LFSVFHSSRSIAPRAIGLIGAGACGVMLLGGSQSGLPQGPTVAFRHDTDTQMKVSFLFGKRDAARQGGAKLKV
jgi:hypothetical protein